MHQVNDMGAMGMCMGWMALLWLVLLAAVAVATVLIVRAVRSGSPGRQDEAVALLRRRYARGEIDQEEFGRRRDDLS